MLPACSSSYKTQNYARLSSAKDFEEEFATVWKAALEAASEFKIEKKDQDDGILRTDWIYSTSNEKYVEYKVNGFPRKKFLQTRYKYLIKLQPELGKVKVTVDPEEEIEKLNSDGSFDGWRGVGEADSMRANEMLRNIELKILGQHP